MFVANNKLLPEWYLAYFLHVAHVNNIILTIRMLALLRAEISNQVFIRNTQWAHTPQDIFKAKDDRNMLQLLKYISSVIHESF